MQQPHTITLYDASAGSGKTFTLVRDYLVTLLSNQNGYGYRSMLAITFTNKAVAEMKTRIIKSLKAFSKPEILINPTDLFNAIVAKTGMDAETIHKRAAQNLHNILQDYASFDIVTIDTFTHRIIRTFARDLKIPQNFEVELNSKEIIRLAVDKLIDRAGTDDQLTSILVEYALEKTNSDKSWDISREFYDIGKLLMSENDRLQINLLKSKSLTHFSDLKKYLNNKINGLDKKIRLDARKLLNYIEEQGLTEKAFSGAYFPKAITKCTEGDFNWNMDTKWIKEIKDKPLYAKSQPAQIKAILEDISPKLIADFLVIKKDVLTYRLAEDLLKKITPLSVLSVIQQEVNRIKADKNIVLINDFNELINQQIIDQPTPFIYERLGERYRNYFIDEFQDTSKLQWTNLIPLIDNAVSSENTSGVSGSLMLVGDPKQAIYRWRGGYAEQFIDLSLGKGPFPSLSKEPLDTNYRSQEVIVTFNNKFFSHCAAYLESSIYSRIYADGNKQLPNTKADGFVSIEFIEAANQAEATPLFLERTLNTGKEILERGIALKDICILVRRNAEGVELATTFQEAGIPVISSESLLLMQSSEVNLIINLFKFSISPDEAEIALSILEFCAQNLKLPNPHTFYQENITLSGQALFQALENYGFTFSLTKLTELPLYEATEYIVRSFSLNTKAGSYLQAFLENIFVFAEKNNSGLYGFLEWWENNKDKLSISTPPGINAIQIMSIHKAKGLEFPIVIYPFATSKIYKHDVSNWYPTDPEEYSGFEHLLLSQKSAIQDYNTTAESLYLQKKQEQQLDALNVLYVALTRASEELYILTSSKAKTPSEPSDYSDFFISYLNELSLWDPETAHYTFGKIPQTFEYNTNDTIDTLELKLISSEKEEHQLKVVTHPASSLSDAINEAIIAGNKTHAILALIVHEKEVAQKIQKAINLGLISLEEHLNYEELIKKLISQLKPLGFFNSKHEVYNERDFLYKNVIYRPDRVEISASKEVFLLDYKTGLPQEEHKLQLASYAQVLKSMGYRLKMQVLVYFTNLETLKIFQIN